MKALKYSLGGLVIAIAVAGGVLLGKGTVVAPSSTPTKGGVVATFSSVNLPLQGGNVNTQTELTTMPSTK